MYAGLISTFLEATKIASYPIWEVFLASKADTNRHSLDKRWSDKSWVSEIKPKVKKQIDLETVVDKSNKH